MVWYGHSNDTSSVVLLLQVPFVFQFGIFLEFLVLAQFEQVVICETWSNKVVVLSACTKYFSTICVGFVIV